MTATDEASLVDWEYWLNRWPTRPIAFTRANAADGYPRALTPLSQDLILAYEEVAVGRFYVEGIGVLTPAQIPEPFFWAFYGLVYLNADGLAKLGETPGNSPQSLYQQFFGLEPDPAYTAPRSPLRARLRGAAVGVRALPRMLRMAGGVETDIARQMARVRAARPTGDLGRLTEPELLDWLRRLDDLQVDAWYQLMAAAGLASAFFEVVRKLLAKVAGDDGDLTNRLHVGLGGNESAESGRAVRELARLARAHGLDSPEFASRLAEMLDRFGHHAPAALELANPSWRAAPEQLVDIVAVEMQRIGEVEDRSGAIRAEAEAELARRVRGVKRRVVASALRRSRALAPMRENGKGPATLLWDELRRLVSVAAPLLAQRAVLPRPELVFYLRHQELRAVLGGGDGPGGAEIERREREHRRCLALELPELVEVGPGWIRPLDETYIRERGMLPPPKLDATETRLHGIAASPGVVTGIARVLHEPYEDFEAGDVLFARTTDPGWAPVLSCASAVVLDIGGVLSHGATVARELGIPCVVNVKVGTERARSGETVQVDGSSGEVLLAIPPNEQSVD